MMKVLFATTMYPSSYKPFSGIFIQDHIKLLSEKYKIQPMVVTGGGSNQNVLTIIKKYFLFLLKTFWFSTVQKIDVIHAHFSYPTGFLTVISSLFNSAPLVLTIHGSDVNGVNRHPFSIKFWANKFTLSVAKSIIAVSDDLKNRIIQVYQIQPDKIHVIDMGVNTKTFCHIDEPSMYQVNSPMVKFLFVGRYVNVKGFQFIIEAIQQIVGEDPTAQFKCISIGSGKNEKQYQNAIHDYNLDQFFEWVGPKNQIEIAEWMNQVDAVIVPSISEGFGLVALESLACGTPVIGSTVGVLPTIISDGINGLLIEPGNTKNLAEKMKLIINKEFHYRKQDCIRSIQDYSQNQKVEQTFHLYQRLVA